MRAKPSFAKLSTLVVAAVVAGGMAASPGSAAPTVTPPPFSGTVSEFYEVPSPLPASAPGELIRVQPVAGAAGVTTLRIMSHSRDVKDQDVAVTGILTYPDGAAPADGWPVVSTASGTAGLAESCAPSRHGAVPPTFGVRGVAVMSDYIGLGPVGEIQPYLNRVSEAHSVIDAVRAARNITEADAGSRWLAFGHSQGGHGAIATNELAASYAPELELLGTAALAPAAIVTEVYGPVDQIVTDIVTAMALWGAAANDPSIAPADYASAKTVEAMDAVYQTGCTVAIIDALVGIPSDEFWTHDPRVTEPARSMLIANDVGNVAVDSPLFLGAGTTDYRVHIDRAHALRTRLCTTGQVTQYEEYEGADHGTVIDASTTDISAWFAARLAGDPALDNCDEPFPDDGVATTTTSTSPPGTPPDDQPPAAEPVADTPSYTG